MTENNGNDMVAQFTASLSADHASTIRLASPWRRIGAVLINLIIFGVVTLPFSGSTINLILSRPVPNIAIDSVNTVYTFYYPIIANIMISSLLFLAILIWQWIWMARYGQSIGKYLLHIKVTTLDGQNPGFNGTVLVREVSFYFLEAAREKCRALCAINAPRFYFIQCNSIANPNCQTPKATIASLLSYQSFGV